MANLVAFLNSFLSYLLLFGVCVAVVVIACVIGIRLRKNKDAKEALMQAGQEDKDDQADAAV
ncbi:MAG: hypothetical protein IKC46_13415 [Lachnospiraceae bacterium]|nr:hypothetical protein [Lachnospiraceae bacterium]